MNINNYIMDLYKSTWDEFCGKTKFISMVTENNAIEIKHNCRINDLTFQDLIYLTCITDCYNNGPKCIESTLEQCLTFQNIEANIPLREYQQIYKTVIIEFPEEYKSHLQAKYRTKTPSAIITQWHNEIFLAVTFFARKDPCIVMFISPAHKEDTIEYSIVSTLEKRKTFDKDYLMSAEVLRMAINLNLFLVNFGHQKLGYKNIKQHRHYERKKPEEAKKDIEYFSLKQNIKLYRKEHYKSESEGTHDSPKAHWRRGHYRHQRYGIQNQFKKLIFIKPVFVCPENFKGSLSDTETNYEV